MRTSAQRSSRATLRISLGAAATAGALSLTTPAVAAEIAAVDVPAWTVQDGVAQAPATIGAVSTLAASSVPPDSWCVSVYGSKTCFQHDGDVVWVLNTAADGMSAVGGICADYGRAAEACRNKSGNGVWVTCDKDYAESGNIRLRALRYDGDTGKYDQPEAYSGWLPVGGNEDLAGRCPGNGV